jgi:uncharacterized membrane protein YphA (DoxX/SURF4 family)
MKIPGEAGRWFFAIAIGGFGIQQIIYKGFVPGITIVPDSMPAHLFWAYAAGALLVVCAIGIALREKAQLASLATGMLFLIIVLILHSHQVSAIIHKDGTERTRAFETLALSAGAFILAGSLRGPRSDSSPASFTEVSSTVGRYVFAFCLIVFGYDHLPIAQFIASLIPAWLPCHLFWAYFTACGFFAAGLSIAVNIGVRLSASLLGLMFFLWVILLHAPRVAEHLHKEGEWNSLFVALAMSGISFVLAAKPSK